MDHEGTMIWQKCIGGSFDEYAYAVHETATGQFIMAGGSPPTMVMSQAIMATATFGSYNW
jgi:hypothetical protein